MPNEIHCFFNRRSLFQWDFSGTNLRNDEFSKKSITNSAFFVFSARDTNKQKPPQLRGSKLFINDGDDVAFWQNPQH